MESHAPTLKGWLARDLTITTGVLAGVFFGQQITEGNPSWYIFAPVCVLGFIGCFALCYVVHEWGHYIGARLSGIRMPLSGYASPFLGKFHIKDYNRRQYLWLSWGGDLGHVMVTVLACLLYLAFPGLATGAFAIGGLAFTVQALAVDQPIIWRVTRGADIESTTAAGSHPDVILKRTWQTWIPLTLVLAAGNLI